MTIPGCSQLSINWFPEYSLQMIWRCFSLSTESSWFEEKSSKWYWFALDLWEVVADGGAEANDLTGTIEIYNKHNSKMLTTRLIIFSICIPILSFTWKLKVLQHSSFYISKVALHIPFCQHCWCLTAESKTLWITILITFTGTFFLWDDEGHRPQTEVCR